MISADKMCILVMKSDMLVKRAALSLMNLEKNLEIVLSEAGDVSEFDMDISKINPNVVLLSESHPMAAKDSLTQLLVHHPALRIVVVSTESNWLHVFSKEDILLTRLDDLLAVIKSG